MSYSANYIYIYFFFLKIHFLVSKETLRYYIERKNVFLYISFIVVLSIINDHVHPYNGIPLCTPKNSGIHEKPLYFCNWVVGFILN